MLLQAEHMLNFSDVQETATERITIKFMLIVEGLHNEE